MTAKGRLVIDIDGVLADFTGEVIRRMGPPRRIDTYSLAKWYPGRHKDISAVVTDPDTYANLDPLEGAKKYIRKMAEAGFHNLIVTARPNVPGMEEVTRKWLNRHFRHSYKELHLVHYKDKPKFVVGLRPHLAFDDSPDHVLAMRKLGVMAIIFTQPYNMGLKELLGVPRAIGWAHVWDLLKSVR